MFSAGDEEKGIGEEVSAQGREIGRGGRGGGAGEGGDEVALEEVGACGEGDGVWNGVFEVGG